MPNDQGTPCRTDPAAWDLYFPHGTWELLRLRQLVRDAIANCYTCYDRVPCLIRAHADPPGHGCVQGGHIWPGDGATAVPYNEWKPTARRGARRRA